MWGGDGCGGDKMGVHIHIDAFTHALPLTRKSTQMLCGSFVRLSDIHPRQLRQ